MNFPEEWKEKSIKDEISISDILYGYAIEDLMKKIEKSSFKEYLWLTNDEALGEQAYKKKTKEKLEFLYVESGKRNFSKTVVAGIAFEKKVLELLEKELFSNNKEETDISWECQTVEKEHGANLFLTCTYMDMHVPITVKIESIAQGAKRPKPRQMEFMFEKKKNCEYLSYSKESILSENLFEIMRKLELISDMEAYDIANETIKSQSISGRHIIEDFKNLGEKEPKVVTMKRLEQVLSYKDYGYMKKRWQQYARNKKINTDEWEEVMERLEKFLCPLWTALCKDEIFFDDWMPELGRFLG